jgi:hypothetical protein
MPLVMHSEREMSGQIGESDPTVPSRKMTLQYDERTRADDTSPSELKNI